MKKLLFSFALILVLPVSLSAQQTTPATAPAAQTAPTETAPAQTPAPDAQPAAAKSLNNDSVIKLVKAGLSDDLIVSTINAQAGSYDTSTDGLISLKAAGVSDKVVSAIVTKANAPAAPVAPPAPAPLPVAAAAPTDPDDPASPHDPGVYLMTTTRDGKQKMLLIERAGSGHEKTANVWGYAFSYGISKMKVKAEIPGPRAAVRTEDQTPVFYMYFPPTGSLGAADTISSPTQFSLLKLEGKKDHRETAVGKVGFASASSGSDEKRVFKFHADRIRSYVFKVTTDETMKAGEYAFIASTGMNSSGGGIMGGGGGSVVIFDFGVDLR